MALCLGTYGDPRGAGVSYERGTPVAALEQGGYNLKGLLDSGLVHKTRRCRGVTYPESYITKYTSCITIPDFHLNPRPDFGLGFVLCEKIARERDAKSEIRILKANFER